MVYDARYACLALSLAAITPSSGAAQTGKGATFTMTMTMTTPMQPSTTLFIGKTQISSSGKGRTDWMPTGGPPRAPTPADRPPLLKPGTYSLTKRGSDTTLIVDPSQHKAWILLRPEAAAGTSRMTYTNVSIAAQRVTPDSAIGGIAVQHWRVTDDHGMPHMIVKTVYDIYCAPDLQIGGINPVTAFTTGSASMGGSDYATKFRAAMVQAMASGFPLRMTTQMAMMDPKGTTTTVSMAMTTSNISHGEPPADTFVLPAGYTTVPPVKE